MMKYRFLLLCCIGILLCGCHPEKKYKDLPEELAALCVNIDKHPKDAEGYYQRADYYYFHKNIEKGIEDMQHAINLQPDSSKYYVKLSDLYFAQLETDLAEEMLLKALQKAPSNNEARLKLAELYFHQRMFNECDKTIQAALDDQRYNPKAYLIKAFMLKELRDTTNYLRMLQMVIDQDPKEVKAYLELGYFYQQQMNPMAIDYYTNALNVDPNNVEIRYNLAKMYQDLGRRDEAIQEYKTAIGIDPTHVPSLNNLGYLYLDDNTKYEEAAQLFTQAIQANPDFVYSYCNRGVAYEYLGEYEKARADYKKALTIKTNFEPAIKGLNRIDEKQK